MITRLEATRYRCFERLGIDVGDFRVLVGANGSGKTTLLDLPVLLGELLRGGRFADKELSLLCSQLAIELRAGLPLVRALRLVADNTDNRRMKKLLEETAGDVQAGYTLADKISIFMKPGYAGIAYSDGDTTENRIAGVPAFHPEWKHSRIVPCPRR